MSGNFSNHLINLLLLIGITITCTSFAQTPISSIGSSSLKERIIQLERISHAHTQLLTLLQQQISDNQNDIDSLRGQIQETQYQLNLAIERQKQILLQIDGNKDSIMTSTDGVVDTVASNSKYAQKSDANTDYNAAIALVQDKSRHNEALAALLNFIKKYPDSTYQSNAKYWLGQLHYSKGEKDDAAFYFASIVKNYSESPKAPDAMFKVGVIMQDKGDMAKAKAVYRKVITKYPGTDSASKAQRRLDLMR